MVAFTGLMLIEQPCDRGHIEEPAITQHRPAQGLAHTLAGHVSAEAGHGKLLDELGLPPLLDLGMRLGEGSGAAVAVLVLRAALACHIGMATFAQAKVSKNVAQPPGSR